MPDPTLSVTVITKNEAARLDACLRSVAWADEIVVVDSGSTDDTVAIARRHTPHVVETTWHGYGPQKNLALDRATGDWVLSLDADEWVPEDLREAIRAAMRSGDRDGWEIRRRSRYCGRPMRFGDWGRDRVLRLFRRGRGRFTDALVHERVDVDGSVGLLRRGRLEHDACASHHAMLETINRYSDLWAEDAFARGRRASTAKALARGGWSFVRTGILLGGFLDGPLGVALAVATAEGTYYRHLKLAEHCRVATPDQPDDRRDS